MLFTKTNAVHGVFALLKKLRHFEDTTPTAHEMDILSISEEFHQVEDTPPTGICSMLIYALLGPMHKICQCAETPLTRGCSTILHAFFAITLLAFEKILFSGVTDTLDTGSSVVFAMLASVSLFALRWKSLLLILLANELYFFFVSTLVVGLALWKTRDLER